MFVFCALFIFLASWDIDHPGLYYDEALFINASFNGPYSDSFIFKRILGVPFMLMPYIGALKAWIFYPIFKIWGCSYHTIRLPMIFTLLFNYKLISTLFNSRAALIFTSLSAVDPTVIFHTRLDWGPTVLMMFFRSLFLLSIIYWLKTKDRKFLFISLGIALFGVFDKVNFIWIVTAGFTAVFLTNLYQNNNQPNQEAKTFKKWIMETNYYFLAFSFIFLLFFIALTKNLSIIEEVGISNISERFSIFSSLIKDSISGFGIYKIIIVGEIGSILSIRYNLILACYFITFIVILYALKKGLLNKYSILFIAIFLLLLALEIFITKQATGAHHIAAMMPFLFLPIYLMISFFLSQKNIIQKILGGLIYFSLFFSSLYIDQLYFESFKNKVQSNWDSSSENVIKELNHLGIDEVICVDWGRCTVIQGLSNNTIKTFDFWHWFLNDTEDSKWRWFESEYLNKRVAFIVPYNARETFPLTRKKFLNLLKERKWQIQHKKIILDSQGEPLNEIYLLTTERAQKNNENF